MTRALRFAIVLLAAAALSAPFAVAQTTGAGVESVTVDTAGIGYTSAPTVSFSGGGGGSGAAASATLTPSVGSVALISGGSGYTTAPSVSFSGGGGSGATANAVLPARGVASVTLISVGVYSSTPTVTFGPPQTAGGRQATGTVVRPSGGDVQSVTITDPGSGYTSPPSVTFSPGLGVNAIGTAVLEAAAVASVTVTEVGSGYTSVPSVSFSGGGGSGATANAALSNSVSSVSVTRRGSGYTSAPSVSFSGGGGSGAAATATLEATVVSGVALASPSVGDTFERAEVIEATVTFVHAVDVDTTGGTPQLALNVGSNTRQASYVSGTGTTELKFRYTVVQADVDSDGITIGASALALNSGTIRLAGSSTVDAVLGLGSHAITDSADHKVNGAALTAAAVSGVAISNAPGDGDTYRLTEHIEVTVTFNRAVNVVTTGGTPQLALTVGTETRQASYTGGTGTTALEFTYALVAGDFDGDGIGVAAGALTLNSGAINDARDATVAAALGLGTHAIAGGAGYKVATPPFISTIAVNRPGAGSWFERGERIEVTVNFNRAVDVTGTPQLALGLGSGTPQADYVSGTGTASLLFRYTVALGDEDSDGLSIGLSALTLNGGTIRASTADRIDASLGLGANAVTNDSNRLVDGMRFTAAAVSTAAGAVSIASSPASGDTYGLGERIAVQVRFTQRVEVTGTPQVELTVGATPRQADYASGSGTNTLTFRYVVQGAGSGGSGSDGVDADTVDGIAIPANALTLNGGAIDDARDPTEAATLTHGAVAASASHKVDGSVEAAPAVSGVTVESAPPAGGAYEAGGEIRLRVSFDRAVAVTGVPTLALTFGSAPRQAEYVSGTGTFDLVFRYVVQPGDRDPDGFSVPADALALNGGTIVVAGGTTAANLDLGAHALSNVMEQRVDAPEPLAEDRLRERLKGVNEAIAPELARAMTAGTLDAVSGRIGQALSGAGASGPASPAAMAEAFAGVLAGNEAAIEEGSWSWKQGLDGRSFALPLSGAAEDGAGAGADSAGRVTVWGAGDYRNLAGEAGGVDWDGHLFGAHVGMDARFGTGGLAGLALSWSEGRFDYTDTSARVLGGKVEGKYESRMRSAHPYVGWSWPSGVRAWGSLGYGRGEVTFIDGEAGRQASDSTLRSASVGGSVRVLSGGEGSGMLGPVAVDVEGEAWTARFDVDGNGERISEMEVRTHRMRVAAEGSRVFELAAGAVLTPSLELGMRLDRGDGETGGGVEVGGGVDYAAPGRGWSADLSGRALLAHEGGSEDWGVGGSVRLAPASGRGLSFRFSPSWGTPEGGLARLWEDGVAGSGAGESRSARLDTEMGYGVAAYAGTLTPYGGLGMSEGGGRDYRLGARYLFGPSFELGLEGERRESRSERAEHGLMLRGRARW